jgi:hypothetical protein
VSSAGPPAPKHAPIRVDANAIVLACEPLNIGAGVTSLENILAAGAPSRLRRT